MATDTSEVAATPPEVERGLTRIFKPLVGAKFICDGQGPPSLLETRDNTCQKPEANQFKEANGLLA